MAIMSGSEGQGSGAAEAVQDAPVNAAMSGATDGAPGHEKRRSGKPGDSRVEAHRLRVLK
jgi:hypothetical protein